jgi:2'-5' RNA ligase
MPLGYHSADLTRTDVNHFAVVVLLPEHLDRPIAPLREQYDPDYSVIQSHVTLVYPFETPRSINEVSDAVEAVTRLVPSLRLELESIGDFYPEFPLIYWNVKKSPLLDELYKSLYSRLDLALPYKSFCPHVTVAREISQHRVVLVKEQVVPYLFEDSFMAPAIDLVSPVASRNWLSVRTFPLSTTV